MIKDVEDIIRNKSYFELSTEELEMVKDLVGSEEEFNQMKWFLIEADSALATEKIEASPELEKRVLAHLTESKRKGGFWLNSVGVFMLPEGKRFYQKPAFQLGIAAALVVGFLFFYDGSIDNSQLAVNEEPIENTNEFDQVVTDENNNETEPTIVEQELKPEEESNIPESPALLNEVISEPYDEIVTLEDAEESYDADIAGDDMELDRIEPPAIIDLAEEELDEDIEMVTTIGEKKEQDNRFNNTNAAGSGELRDYKETEELRNERGFSERLKKSKDKDKGYVDNESNELADEVEVDAEPGTAYSNTNANTTVTDVNVTNNSVVSAEVLSLKNADTKMATAEEYIAPKSLHINSTKELNKLFHIEK